MRSKSTSGTTLYRMNLDVRVENEIFMDNAPKHNDYNTEIQRVERILGMDVHTTEPHFPWKNNSESVIKIIKEKYNRRRFHINIPKRVWDFGMVWETEIYHHIEVKDGFPALGCLTVDTIDISEWLEFEFYDLICFWNNHPKDTKPILGQSHRVGSELCYWIISEKGKVLSHTTVQHLTADKPRYPKFQEQIHDYHGSLETAL